MNPQMLHLILRAAVCPTVLLCSVQTELYSEQISAQDLLNSTLESERQIENVRAKVLWFESQTNRPLVDYAWGYDGGKEFVEGSKYTREMIDNLWKTSSYFKRAFDGETLRLFTDNSPNGIDATSGRICSYKPSTFRGWFTPFDLLGYDTYVSGLKTFGECLKNAASLTVRGDMEKIDDFSCCIIEADEVPVDDEHYNDIRAWIDIERGFRPLKIEFFYHTVGKNKWEGIVRRIHKIKLAKIAGIWFPIEGEQQTFYTKSIKFSEGVSVDALEDKAANADVEMALLGLPQVIRVDIDSTEINQNMSEEMFTVEFPQGCYVWDEFKQIGYRVGGRNDVIAGELDRHSVGSDTISGKHLPNDRYATSKDSLETDNIRDRTDNIENETHGYPASQNNIRLNTETQGLTPKDHVYYVVFIFAGISVLAMFVLIITFVKKRRSCAVE